MEGDNEAARKLTSVIFNTGENIIIKRKPNFNARKNGQV